MTLETKALRSHTTDFPRHTREHSEADGEEVTPLEHLGNYRTTTWVYTLWVYTVDR